MLIKHILHGKEIYLKPSTLSDKYLVYEWASNSDITKTIMGPPIYPEHPVPTWEEFCTDHKDHFFDGSAPLLGQCFIIMADNESVGQIYYNDIETFNGKKRTELDLWMKAEQYCGKGYGSDALRTLVTYLAEALDVQEFMVQPSARNPRAIRAYEKVGFAKLPLSVAEANLLWGPNDYYDSVYMVKTVGE